jgi:NAD(P)-dependent dehydrogenase (short-subunit alcohol dehydrogenase family)
MTFTEKTILVAGGTGGLGRAVSLAFLEHGANLVVTWRNNTELAALKDAARSHSARIDAVQANLADPAVVNQVFDGIVARHGRLDALVNTVGGFAGGSPMWESPVEALDKMLDVNLRAGYLLSAAAVKAMLKQRTGAIVNIASKAALTHPPGLAAYSASKAAAVAMMDSLAADLMGTGVRVNSVLPDIIDTEVNRKAMPNADFAKWPKPEAIAKVILFLCSDDASLIHGASIPVYGH